MDSKNKKRKYNRIMNSIDLINQHKEEFDLYAKLLQEWNEKFNLTAIVDTEEIFNKHFLDSLDIVKYLDEENISLVGKLADVGTGAGFPGLVIKIVKPELEVTLIEPTLKRCTFLNEVINKLNLKNVDVVNERSEDYALKHFQQFDFVCARAVAQMGVLTELCLPLVKKQGHFIAFKGPKAYQELQESKAIEMLGGRINQIKEYVSNDSTRVLIDILKEKDTDRKYPRNYSQIKKKPL